MKQGAFNFLEKSINEQVLTLAIDAALRTSVHISGSARSWWLQRIATLSRQERQVINALVAGRPSKIIAFELGISVRTVEVHRARMFDRLGIQKLAPRRGWLNRDRSCGTRRAKTKKTRVSTAE